MYQKLNNKKTTILKTRTTRSHIKQIKIEVSSGCIFTTQILGCGADM